MARTLSLYLFRIGCKAATLYEPPCFRRLPAGRGSSPLESAVDRGGDDRFRVELGDHSKVFSQGDRYHGMRVAALPSSFEDEIVIAQAVYREACKVVEECLEEVRLGKAIKTDRVGKVVERLVESVLRNHEALTSLSRVKSLDRYTLNHSVNTSVLALALGGTLDMNWEELQWLGVGALLHDIGKVKIPIETLNKPGRYRPHEYEIMKQHALRGAELLASTSGLPEEAAQPALEHHERMDGSGYPFQRHGREVSRFGRIASIVDIYDAVTTDRVYQKALSPHGALQLLYNLAQQGKLDQPLVERFIRCVGVYPVGSCVELDAKEIALVTQIHRDHPLSPKVLIIRGAGGRPLAHPRSLDLAAQGGQPPTRITAVLDPHELGINPNLYLDAEPAVA